MISQIYLNDISKATILDSKVKLGWMDDVKIAIDHFIHQIPTATWPRQIVNQIIIV